MRSSTQQIWPLAPVSAIVCCSLYFTTPAPGFLKPCNFGPKICSTEPSISAGKVAGKRTVPVWPTTIGKKNFLFIGHPEAGQRSAVIYSVLGSCRRHGLKPAEYLQNVFERLPKARISELPSLTPSAWAKSRRRQKSQAVS